MADYSTYARVVLSNSESISNLVRKYSIAPPETKYATSAGLSHLAVLTNQQILDAFYNPQSSLKPTLPIYAEIMQTHRAIIAAQQKAYEQQLFIEESVKKIQEKFTNADKNQIKTLQDSTNKLEKHYRNLTALQKQLSDLESQLFDYEKKLSSYTIQHDQAWDQFRAEMLQAISSEIQQRNIPLSELEQKDLITAESWAEIIRRYQTLGLMVPDYVDVNEPDFATYFELKAYLAIHGSLSRRMLPNTAEDIEKLS